MGLNSFITNIIIMTTILIPKHYINYSSYNNTKFLDKSLDFTRLLCEDCYIDVLDGNYCKHFYRKSSPFVCKDYFGSGKHLYMNNLSIYKKQTQHVPFEHVAQHVTQKHYKINKKSQLTLVTETVKNIDIESQPYSKTVYTICSNTQINPMDKLVYDELCSLVSLFN